MAYFRSVATVGLLTLLSRVLGFIRDLLTATMLGAGQVADAFVVAQRLPNAFRAIFAEGAMDTAFVPIYARKRRLETEETTAEFVNHIFTILVLFLLPMTVLSIYGMPFIINVIAPGFSEDPERFALAVTYSRIAFGFLFLISLSALQGSLLNARSNFAPLAAAPAILNAVMIGGFVVAWLFHLDVGLCGSWSMIAGGVVQLLVLQISCARAGLKLHLSRPRLTKDVRQFFRLVGPGVIGVSAAQINVLVTTTLASTLPAGAISALYYADRLDMLPLGVIGGAISTTLLPVLTHHLAAKEDKSVIEHFSRAIEIGLFLCLPACAILVLVPTQIVKILFQHGVFNADHTRITAETIAAYSLLVPGNIMARILTTRYYAHQDSKTPVLIGIAAIIVNAVCCYALRNLWQHIGIALGLAFSTTFYAAALWYFLHRRGQAKIDSKARRRLPLLVIASIIMGLVLWGISPPIESEALRLFGTRFLAYGFALLTEIVICTIFYLGFLQMTGGVQLKDLRALRRGAGK